MEMLSWLGKQAVKHHKYLKAVECTVPDNPAANVIEPAASAEEVKQSMENNIFESIKQIVPVGATDIF